MLLGDLRGSMWLELELRWDLLEADHLQTSCSGWMEDAALIFLIRLN